MSISEKRDSALKLPQVSRPITVKEQVYQTLREQLLHGQPGRERARHRKRHHRCARSIAYSRSRGAFAAGQRRTARFHAAWLQGAGVLAGRRASSVRGSACCSSPSPRAKPRRIVSMAGLSRWIVPSRTRRQRMRRGAVTQFLRAHSTFREFWLKRARNPLLLDSLGRTVHSLQAIRRRTMSDSVMRQFIIRSHENLLAAIEAGKPDDAERVQTNTIREFEALVTPGSSRSPVTQPHLPMGIPSSISGTPRRGVR